MKPLNFTKKIKNITSNGKFSIFSSIIFYVLIQNVAASCNANGKPLSLPDAKVIAEGAFKKYSDYKIKNFSCRLIEETKQIWSYGCEEATKTPLPGSVLFIIIDRITGKVTLIPGK